MWPLDWQNRPHTHTHTHTLIGRTMTWNVPQPHFKADLQACNAWSINKTGSMHYQIIGLQSWTPFLCKIINATYSLWRGVLVCRSRWHRGVFSNVVIVPSRTGLRWHEENRKFKICYIDIKRNMTVKQISPSCKNLQNPPSNLPTQVQD